MAVRSVVYDHGLLLCKRGTLVYTSAVFHARDGVIINTRVLYLEDVLSVRDLASHRFLMTGFTPTSQTYVFLSNAPLTPLLFFPTVASMGSNDQMEWLPGLGIQSRSRSEVFTDLESIRDTQAIDPSVDEVQFSIVCEDCGKHFWSRSKANSHAALTTHVLHEDDMVPGSPVTVPESPTTNPVFTHTPAGTWRDMKFAEQEGSEGSGDDDYGSSFECGEFPYGAANSHANLECIQDTEFVPSSAPSGSLASGILSAAVARDTPAAESSIHPSSPSWNASRARLPNTTITGAGISTSPVNRGRAVPTTTPDIFSETSGRVLDPVPEQSSPPFAPNVSQRDCMAIKRAVC